MGSVDQPANFQSLLNWKAPFLQGQSTPAVSGTQPAKTNPGPVLQPSPPTLQAADQLKRTTPQGQALPKVNLDPVASPTTHTVKKNESLSTIAKKYFGNPNLYMEIYNANRDLMKHPNQVHAGMVLKLPAHLFPTAGQETPKPGPSLNQYRQQNPLSYVTMGPRNELKSEPKVDPNRFQDIFGTLPFFTKPQSQNPPATVVETPSAEEQEALKDISTSDKTQGTTLIHQDAVKVNKRFDITPAMTAANLSTKFGPWAREVAAVLKDNQASIRLPMANGQTVSLSPEKLEELAGKPIQQVKDFFAKDLGIATLNTLWAIDDVVTDMRHDPYYADHKKTPKTLDLAAVADDFNIKSDKANYLAGTAAHRHKQVPVELQSIGPVQSDKGRSQSSEKILSDLAKHFNARGVLTNSAQFEKEVYEALKNPSARRKLVEEFGLNSAENLSMLAPAITSEGGMAANQSGYNSYFAVGSVMLNRALGRNLRKAAAHVAQNKPMDQFKPISMKSIIFEENQFEITWRPMPGSGGKTFFQYAQGLNQAFLKNKLGEGNSKEAYSTAYEVARDLFSGMNQLQADVDGQTRKNVGRSTADLFYFNQSRAKDFSQNPDAAVKLIDENQTHVFFERWDKRSYFLD